ncbi:ImmA/IrrE family metallo-endopeptidase [Deinococcus sp. PEB2-63]
MAKTAPPFTHDRLEHLQQNADVLRAQVGAGPDGPVDAFALAAVFGARIEYLDGDVDPGDFSGMVTMHAGQPVIVLNRNMSAERRNITLLEELCHLHYRHPVEEWDDQGRQHTNVTESEAYQTGAAVLLPAIVVAKAVYKNRAAADVAREYGVSKELFEMRVKVLGLWPHYQGRKAA